MIEGRPRIQPIRRRTRRAVEVMHPGIPGADNRWFPTQREARLAAWRRASQLGPDYGVIHDSRPQLGWPHYHVVYLPASRRVSGHFFYGGRPPRQMFRGRPGREAEAVFETQAPYRHDPTIARICRDAGELANELRQAIQNVWSGRSSPAHRAIATERLRRKGTAWINHISNEMLPILKRFHPRDLDMLVGCIARVEHAIGREPVPFRRLKAAVKQILGIL
jgi:hypothetical protein